MQQQQQQRKLKLLEISKKQIKTFCKVDEINKEIFIDRDRKKLLKAKNSSCLLTVISQGYELTIIE